MSLQQEIKRFIEAINKDIKSGLHSVNDKSLLENTISILNSLNEDASLSLLQVIRGCLNMVVDHEELSAYLDLPTRSAEIAARCNRFLIARATWCDIKNDGLESEEALALILFRAAKGPLYLSARCVPNTMALYLELLKERDEHFVPPRMPESDKEYVKSANYYFEEMVYQYPLWKKNELLVDLLYTLFERRALKIDGTIAEVAKINDVLSKLQKDLSTAIKNYMLQTEKSFDEAWISEQKRLLGKISSVLIQQAKSSLKDSWKDWLSDLFTH